MYLVGGAVRDLILGNRRPKDLDFTVVFESWEDGYKSDDPFAAMRQELLTLGFEIFVENPEYLTIRARFPTTIDKNSGVADQNGVFTGMHHNGLTADFVLARKESDYTDGRRPDKVEPGTLIDDLSRRDFTMNAIALADDGTLFDPFRGEGDIVYRIIRPVGNAQDRLDEDALRAVRALRFSVTKGFNMTPSLEQALESESVVEAIEFKISDERIDIELKKMFRYDTIKSLQVLSKFPHLTEAIFSGRVTLDSTMKYRRS